MPCRLLSYLFDVKKGLKTVKTKDKGCSSKPKDNQLTKAHNYPGIVNKACNHGKKDIIMV